MCLVSLTSRLIGGLRGLASTGSARSVLLEVISGNQALYLLKGEPLERVDNHHSSVENRGHFVLQSGQEVEAGLEVGRGPVDDQAVKNEAGQAELVLDEGDVDRNEEDVNDGPVQQLSESPLNSRN